MADNKTWCPTLAASNKPLYLQIVDAMAADIATGKLAIGEKLPPQRKLAWQLNINHSTVTKAFLHAAKQHLIAGEVGRGTYVLGQSSEAELFLLKQQPAQATIDLSTHVPVAFSQDRDLSEALMDLSQHADSELLSYHSAAALTNIKLVAAKWLNQLGYPINASNCIVTASAQNALLVSLIHCCNKDDIVLVNELTFPGMKAAAKQLGLKLYGVKMDQHGIIPQELDLAIRTTHAKVLVSDTIWQNPTATTMPVARQQAFLAVIKKHKITLIDEYVIGAVSKQPPISTTVKSQTILITSFAKAIAPGIRFAIIAGEHQAIAELQYESHATSWQVSPLIAAVASNWITEGIAAKRLQQQHDEVLARFKLYKAIFAESHYPYNLQPCSHIWLPTHCDSEHASKILAQQCVIVVPSATFLVGHQDPNYIRVSLTAATSRQQLKIALTVIKQSALIISNDC